MKHFLKYILVVVTILNIGCGEETITEVDKENNALSQCLGQPSQKDNDDRQHKAVRGTLNRGKNGFIQLHCLLDRLPKIRHLGCINHC